MRCTFDEQDCSVASNEGVAFDELRAGENTAGSACLLPYVVGVGVIEAPPRDAFRTRSQTVFVGRRTERSGVFVPAG